jgi:hypothetical protein
MVKSAYNIIFLILISVPACNEGNKNKLESAKKINEDNLIEVQLGRSEFINKLKDNATFILVDLGENDKVKIVDTGVKFEPTNRINRLAHGKNFNIFYSDGASHVLIVQHNDLNFESSDEESIVDYIPVYNGKAVFSYQSNEYSIDLKELFDK